MARQKYYSLKDVVVIVSVMTILLLGLPNCKQVNDAINPPPSHNEQRMIKLIIFAELLKQYDPCYNLSRPLLSSAQPTITTLANVANLTGKIVDDSGNPVVGSLVQLNDPDPASYLVGTPPNDIDTFPTYFFSTHSSIDGDGTFFLAGVPTTSVTNYRLSLEPLSSDFDYGIDFHLDCFKSSQDFMEGWYDGVDSITNSEPTVGNVDISSGGTIDLGVITLRTN